MNENSKIYFVLNSLASNTPTTKDKEKYKITLRTMKFDTLDLSQNAWHNVMELKKEHSTIIKICL